MNFTNINDPAGVSALLEQLRSSQAWTDLQAQQNAQPSGAQPPKAEPPSQPQVTQHAAGGTSKDGSKPSVASLLSQLGSSSAAGYSVPPPAHAVPMTSQSPPSPPTPSSSPQSPRAVKDVRNYTFQQALPHLAQLSDDPAFVDAISKLRRDQTNLEKQLWNERQALHAKQSEKVKIAVTKANMLGTGISEREANAMKQVFENELSKFDRDRVVPAWEGLIARQQAALEKLGVPAMFMSSEKQDLERQQRIIQVLEGIVGPGAEKETS